MCFMAFHENFDSVLNFCENEFLLPVQCSSPKLISNLLDLLQVLTGLRSPKFNAHTTATKTATKINAAVIAIASLNFDVLFLVAGIS